MSTAGWRRRKSFPIVGMRKPGGKRIRKDPELMHPQILSKMDRGLVMSRLRCERSHW